MTYVSEVTADSPIEWWRLGESSGTSAASIGSGAHAGTYTAGFTLGATGALTVSGDTNTAVTLNGTTGHVLLPSAIASLNGSAFTFECWVKTSDTAKQDQALYSGYENAGAFGGFGVIYNLGFMGNTGRIGYYSSASGTWVESTGAITDTAYHHVAVTVSSGGAVTFYIDGAAAGTVSSAAPGNWTGAKAIGSTSDGTGNFFKGTLDEASLYSTVLSAARVAAHRSAGITAATVVTGRTKPPLGLTVEVTDAAGTRRRWDPAAKLGGNRPQNLGFTTKRGEGFSEGSVTLARRIDQDHPDINLFDDVAFIGADGSIAYEGRIAAQPRSFGQTHSIGVQCAGWMSHARDKPFTDVFIDRDLSAWQPTSRTRQVALLAANFSLGSFEAQRDSTNTLPALALKIEGAWVSPYMPLVEALYDAGSGNAISAVFLATEGGAGVAGAATFNFTIQGGPTDVAPDVSTSDIWAGTNTAAYHSLTARRYITLQFTYPTTPAGSDGAVFVLNARKPAVYGDHGISVIGADDPKGVPASEVIKYIANAHCPKLNTVGVQDTLWPIPHLVFKEPTDPYDAFLAVNAFHLWELGVWENKTLVFGPANRTDWDWEVRLSDFGVTVDLQGDSTEDLANGIIVSFTDVASGAKVVLTPDDDVNLVDPNPDNPATMHGLQRWPKIVLSSPTTTAAAVQIGRAALTEFNAPKAPGTINVVGHLRDRSGHWQQGWKVRAGDTIAITDHPNDAPRLITETSWNHDSKQLTVTVDSSAKRLDAVLDRLGTALSAAGLS